MHDNNYIGRHLQSTSTIK